MNLRPLGVTSEAYVSFSTELHEKAESGVREIVADHVQGLVESDRQVTFANRLIYAIGAFVVCFNLAVVGWGAYRAATLPTVTLSDPQLLGPTNLCPGETLDYTFVMVVSREALIELKTSVQKLQPDARISYARLQEFSFEEATKLEFVRHWVTPPTYSDPVSGTEVAWEPGPYEQITIANVAGRGKVSEIRVPFSIRESCRGG